jgi:hypothetical protein
MSLVVPDGWLTSAAGGAVGVAVPGLRGVILEANSPAYTLSHEISHVFGVQHTQGLVPAFGARVDTRVNRAGNDWMAPITQPKAWTGGRTWDQLVTAIGGPANAPQPLDSYVVTRLSALLADATAARTRLIFAHVTAPTAFPIQRLAERGNEGELAETRSLGDERQRAEKRSHHHGFGYRFEHSAPTPGIVSEPDQVT